MSCDLFASRSAMAGAADYLRRRPVDGEFLGRRLFKVSLLRARL